MRNGNISNKPTPTILVRMDSTMFQELPRETLKEKLLYKFGKRPKYRLIRPMASFLNFVAVNTDYNVNLVFLDTDKDSKMKEEILDKQVLNNFNILDLTQEMLDGLLDYTECFLVSDNCYRDKVYSLSEAIHQFTGGNKWLKR